MEMSGLCLISSKDKKANQFEFKSGHQNTHANKVEREHHVPAFVISDSHRHCSTVFMLCIVLKRHDQDQTFDGWARLDSGPVGPDYDVLPRCHSAAPTSHHTMDTRFPLLSSV